MRALAVSFDGRRTIPSPEVTRVMLELLDLKPGEKVLEIGTGSGYQTQELAKTGAEVHSIELEPWVDPTVIIGECVFLHSGNGLMGLPQEAPFDAIVASCGLEQIPVEWIEQLRDGGRIIAPIGDISGQRLTRFRMDVSGFVPERVAAYCRFQMAREQPPKKPVRPVYA